MKQLNGEMHAVTKTHFKENLLPKYRVTVQHNEADLRSMVQ